MNNWALATQSGDPPPHPCSHQTKLFMFMCLFLSEFRAAKYRGGGFYSFHSHDFEKRNISQTVVGARSPQSSFSCHSVVPLCPKAVCALQAQDAQLTSCKTLMLCSNNGTQSSKYHANAKIFGHKHATWNHAVMAKVIGKSALEIGQFLRRNFWIISGGPFLSPPLLFYCSLCPGLCSILNCPIQIWIKLMRCSYNSCPFADSQPIGSR